MTYSEWEADNIAKRNSLVLKLQHKTIDEIVKYFEYDNMIASEPDYCGLYKQGTKCHDIPNLNCYNCGCPHFIYDENGLDKLGTKVVYSKCNINAKDGSMFESDNAIHQDCSNCVIPHGKQAATKELKINRGKYNG